MLLTCMRTQVDSALSALRDEDPWVATRLAQLRSSLGLELFRSVDVIHCRDSYALVLKCVVLYQGCWEGFCGAGRGSANAGFG
jgi:hypothetical protein